MSDVDPEAGRSEIHEVWDQLQRTEDPDEREFLLERLAEAALECHDFSDAEVHEDVHEQFERLRRVREEYHLTAVRVGRFVARLMDSHDIRERMNAHTDNSGAN